MAKKQDKSKTDKAQSKAKPKKEELSSQKNDANAEAVDMNEYLRRRRAVRIGKK